MTCHSCHSSSRFTWRSEALAAAESGVTIGQYREGDRLIDVALRAPKDGRGSLAALGELPVPAPSGKSVPLSQLATVHESLEEPILWSRSRELALTVRADIVDGVQAPDVTDQILPRLADIEKSLPSGYRIEAGGAVEENTKAQASIAVGMPMMVAIVLGLLMIQLKSFSRTFMVVLTAPLGLVGVALALLAFAATIAPWLVRDYRTFGRFIFIRDNFWAEMRYGNSEYARGIWMGYTHPLVNDSELRRYVRIPIFTEVTLTVQGRKHEATSMEVSAGGMSLKTQFRAAPPTAVELEFTLPDSQHLAVGASVCWQREPDLLGVRFEAGDLH